MALSRLQDSLHISCRFLLNFKCLSTLISQLTLSPPYLILMFVSLLSCSSPLLYPSLLMLPLVTSPFRFPSTSKMGADK